MVLRTLDVTVVIFVIVIQGTSVCQATAIGAAVILLYTSRACYNLVVVALSPEDRPSPFNYGWYNVSDQVFQHTYIYCFSFLYIIILLFSKDALN